MISELRGLVVEHIAKIRAAKVLGVVTPEIVQSYVLLMNHTDGGLPIEFADFHFVWLQLLCNEDIKKLLIIAPPGSAKTTIIMAYLGCRLGIHPDENYIIGSVTDDVAEKRSLSLRNTVDGGMWRTIFPDVAKNESMKWEQKEWSIHSKGSSSNNLHPTLRAYGTGSSIIGSRADVLVGDDLLDSNNTHTQSQREKFEYWMDTSFLSRRKAKTGRTILIGTSWSSSDYYAKIRKSYPDWVTCHVPMLGEKPFRVSLSYPDSWTGEVLGEGVGNVSN